MFIQRRFWLLPLHLHITVSYIFLCLNEWRLPSWKWIMNVFTLRIRCFCSRRMWRSCIQEHKCAQMGSASLPSYHLRGTELCKTKDKADWMWGNIIAEASTGATQRNKRRAARRCETSTKVRLLQEFLFSLFSLFLLPQSTHIWFVFLYRCWFVFLIGCNVALWVQRCPHVPFHVGYLHLQVHRDNGFDLRGALRGPRSSVAIASSRMENTPAINTHKNTEGILSEAAKQPREAAKCL